MKTLGAPVRPNRQVTATLLRSLHTCLPVLADTELCWELWLHKAEQYRQPLLSLTAGATLHVLYLPGYLLKLTRNQAQLARAHWAALERHQRM